MTTRTPSRLTDEVAEMAAAQHRLGLMDAESYRKITVRHLTEEPPTAAPLSGEQIKAIREKAYMSQGAFARHLQTSVGHVSKLERGEVKATGTTLALLNVIRRKGIEVLL